MRKADEILLCLLKVALGGDPDAEMLCGVTGWVWKEVVDRSFDQGVVAIAVDGYQKLAKMDIARRADDEEWEDERLDWFGEVLEVEEDAWRLRKSISSLASLYRENGIEMMVLKGFGLALNWPVPEHRPVGDIDIFHFGKWREADEVVRKLGVEVDYSHHHHSVFEWRGHLVENHYDMVNRFASRNGRVVDDMLKGLAMKERRDVDVEGVRVFLPSATFNGVFLLRHMASHFSGDHIGLRHLLDWALFVDKDWREIDWDYVVDWAGRMGQRSFLSCLNGLCVNRLGIVAEKFPLLERDLALEERVLGDILYPTFSEKGSGFFFKLRRLRANRWKRDLVKEEAFLPRMVRLAWSHLRRPYFVNLQVDV